MIEWKKYPDNQPEYDKEYIVHAVIPQSNNSHICIAEFKRWSDGKGHWEENFDYTTVFSVTHYAEINLPDRGE
ncbi:hypothetical protein MO973_19510 [Paenibacillus sp. TRM 82003]|nr:hypothetical protein [Paenibacillus sp. TRM 82003]